jgi:hypothetical protein
VCFACWCARPTGGSHGLTTEDPAQRYKGAKRRAAPRRGPQSAAKGIIEAGVLHLASLQRGSPILREDCYNVVTRAPTVGNDSVVPDSKRERGGYARYALLGTRSAGDGRRPGARLGAVPIGPPLALAASRGGSLKTSPARKCRAMGRIEHTLLDGVNGQHPNRPKTFARNRTLPQEMTNVSIYDKGRDSSHTVISGTFLRNRAKRVNYR